MNRNIARCAIAILVVPFMLGCNAITGIFTGPSDIEYRASGTAARVSLTYETEDGTEQIGSSALPWAYSRNADDGIFSPCRPRSLRAAILIPSPCRFTKEATSSRPQPVAVSGP